VPCFLGERRSILPSLSEAVWNSSAESLIMACSVDGGPPQVEPMTMVSEPSAMGERLSPSNRSAMNSRLPKRMVSPREKSPHDRRSPPTVMASTDDGTIGTSRRKACYKSPFSAHQQSVFSTPIRIGWSRSCIPVLRWSCELQSTL
jgi:hypothetical protein